MKTKESRFHVHDELTAPERSLPILKGAVAGGGQLSNFLKNAGLLGGLLLAAVDTEGKPSVGYRARRAAHKAADSTEKSFAKAQKRAAKAQKRAKKQAIARWGGGDLPR